MGIIPGSIWMPLSTLRESCASVPLDYPVITVCPAGARSAMAAAIMEKAGIDRVANMRGGLIEWIRMGLPTAPSA
jgi:rhodanese-related sulfurtransferase